MRRHDYIIVGCGFFGSTLAERLHSAGKSVLMIERREHIGGNCYSYEYKGTNIMVHKYGTHIFHTDNAMVWDYVNKFGGFNRYQHRVLTTHKNMVYAMPINLGTINAFYGINLRPSQVNKFISSKRGDIKNPKNLEEKAISLIGRDLYEAFIKGYTIKQWGCDPKELSPDIIERLPVRTSFYDSYYNDTYQGLPKDGYTAIFKNMLKGIPIELGVDFIEERDKWRGRCKNLIYTGPIDRYFDYRFGRLGWRSARFEIKKLGLPDYQGTSVMNYADTDVPYTRIHEPKHLHLEKVHTKNTTVIIKEYPHVNDNEPYYPINSDSDKQLLRKYRALAKKEPDVVFGGRLADYKYYDMHHVIELALCKFLSFK
ncbi:MAG: UDP-galactopyranose mutase [Candidatus Omnitrophica bacterium]|nr:UDP-galactopyranose mutase [Candidatus Omnitrophota bacterium]